MKLALPSATETQVTQGWALFLTKGKSLMTLTRAAQEGKEDRSLTGEGQGVSGTWRGIDKRTDNCFQVVFLGKGSTERNSWKGKWRALFCFRTEDSKMHWWPWAHRFWKSMMPQKEENCKCDILEKAREEGLGKLVEDWPLAGPG